MRIILVILLLPVFLSGVLIEVAQDGSGDYASVNEAMEVSEPGDSILVNPGIYYENIYLDHDINLFSMYAITGDESYISNTILDGNDENCVVFTEKYNNENFEVFFAGFTIQNGFARTFLGDEYPSGAGIYACGINITIDGCFITDNCAAWGGGVYIGVGTMNMSNTIITGNTGYFEIGGLLIENSECYFSEVNLNDIYLNYGGKINDIFYLCEEGDTLNIHLDTFTVNEYDSYFVKSFYDPYVEDPQYINLICDNYVIEHESEDIFVSPIGSNNNSGLSVDDPLRSVCYALALYKSENSETHTIHLSDGYYGKSANGEYLPWQLKSNLIIEGESEENTIISTEGKTGHLRSNEGIENATVRNMTLQEGNMYSNIKFLDVDGITLDHITVSNINWVDTIADIRGCQAELKNLTFRDNVTGMILTLSHYSDQYMLLENILISGVYQWYDLAYPCDGVKAISTMSDSPLEYARFDLINCKFVDIYTDNCTYPMTVGHGCCFSLFSDVNMVNCLVSNSRVDNDRDPCLEVLDSRLNMVNSIIYNVDNEAILLNYYSMMIPEVTVSHSLIQDGENGVIYGLGILNWLDGNLDCDPMFDMSEPNRYSLLEGSPCIDAGTLNLPEGLEMPEYDLAGNPRISGNMIDMGPYEWQYPDSNDENEIAELEENIIIYPNPISFNMRDSKVKILWMGESSDGLNIEIFNIKGQRIRTLKIQNSQLKIAQAAWDLCDDAGEIVSSGVYFVRVKAGDNYIAQSKVTVVK
ncbi:MAG: DUF1565 domain-containing protein [Candidatus Stygibacter australis]|nr:DUF1565 domain-containing protein [Candidatus Stygibacter australis]MDP8322961.1 DUF1565 domain-containing protein [Candidatus Stygibacter australis]